MTIEIWCQKLQIAWYLKELWTDYDKTWWMSWEGDNNRPIRYWLRLGCISGLSVECKMQATFQSWPEKPSTDWASSIIQCPSANLNSYPPTRLSSTAWWSTALPSGLAPLPHILLSLPSQTGQWSLCLLPPHFWSCTHCSFCTLFPQVSAGLTRSTINPF